jgi:hypothetical protein
MNQDKSLKSMVSMTNVCESMETLTFGNISLIFSIYFPLLRLSNQRFSVSMEACLPVSIVWIKLDSWIEFRKFLMKVLCVICYGQTLMIDAVGASHLEVLDTPLDKIFQNNSIILII